MTSKHTPGPWQWHPELNLILTDDYVIAENIAPTNPRGFPEISPMHTANAALIAASPDLLRCLCELLGMAEVDLMDDKSNVWRNAMSAARAAIAKATGGEA